MSHGKPKTTGLEWLMFSLQAFNGSGYADMDSPEDFLNSYIAYKAMRKKKDAVNLARVYQPEALVIIAEILQWTAGAGRLPSEKNLDKFNAFRRAYENNIQTPLF